MVAEPLKTDAVGPEGTFKSCEADTVRVMFVPAVANAVVVVEAPTYTTTDAVVAHTKPNCAFCVQEVVVAILKRPILTPPEVGIVGAFAEVKKVGLEL